MYSELILKFLKFSVVGFTGLILDFSLTYLLREKAKINQYVANSVGFSAAVVSNFFLNKYWTFLDSNPDVAYQFSKFLLISICGLLLNNGIIFILRLRDVQFYFAKAMAIAIVVLWNFIMNYKYAFA